MNRWTDVADRLKALGLEAMVVNFIRVELAHRSRPATMYEVCGDSKVEHAIQARDALWHHLRSRLTVEEIAEIWGVDRFEVELAWNRWSTEHHRSPSKWK